MAFDLDRFVAAARAAAVAPRPSAAILELMRETVADPSAVVARMPAQGGDDAIFHEDETVCVSWARFSPRELVPPHNHKIAAFIGVYRGVEVNRFYRAEPGRLTFVSERRVAPGETLSIGAEGIHAVHAGDDAPCEALHVYLGPLSTTARELFDPVTGASMSFTDERYAALLGPPD